MPRILHTVSGLCNSHGTAGTVISEIASRRWYLGEVAETHDPVHEVDPKDRAPSRMHVCRGTVTGSVRVARWHTRATPALNVTVRGQTHKKNPFMCGVCVFNPGTAGRGGAAASVDDFRLFYHSRERLYASRAGRLTDRSHGMIDLKMKVRGNPRKATHKKACANGAGAT